MKKRGRKKKVKDVSLKITSSKVVKSAEESTFVPVKQFVGVDFGMSPDRDMDDELKMNRPVNFKKEEIKVPQQVPTSEENVGRLNFSQIYLFIQTCVSLNASSVCLC